MRNIKVIIGANAGDEGKGLATDYFASQYEHGLVVMTNGGSQRAHTVELNDGTRHVFQHFGSGTLRGWDTYYSPEFILNPMQFCKEYEELKKITNKKFKIFCDSNCRWSTPWDMLANQIDSRIESKHNTCGMGIWHTIIRYKYFEYNNLKTYSLWQFSRLKPQQKLEYIRSIKDYYKNILMTSMYDDSVKDLVSLIDSKGLLDHFYADVMRMDQIIGAYTMPLYLYDNIIFENGQGLLIDSEADVLYGTPSYTGLKIPKAMIWKYFHSDNIEVCYVTRSYLTRHGDGFLQEEVNKDIINPFMSDQTNYENDFQGSLRFGNLYPNDLINRIDKDWANNISLSPFIDFNVYEKSLMITHLNECSFPVEEIKNNFANVYLSDTKFSKDIRKCDKG